MWLLEKIRVVELERCPDTAGGILLQVPPEGADPRGGRFMPAMAALPTELETCWCLLSCEIAEDEGRPAHLACLDGNVILVDEAKIMNVWRNGVSGRLFLLPKSAFPELEAFAPYLASVPLKQAEATWGKLLAVFMSGLTPDVLDEVISTPSGRFIVERQLSTLLRMLLETLARQFAGLLHSPATDERRRRLLRNILIWLQDNFAQPGLSASVVAEKFNVSVRYVHQLFADFGTETGAGEKRTFLATLNLLRLEYAACLLKSEDSAAMTVTEVAWRCGYSDAVYFGKVFKLRYGAAPGKMRAQWQQMASSEACPTQDP